MAASRAGTPGTVELSSAPLDRPHASPDRLALNNTILTEGTLAFVGAYDPSDGTGQLKAVLLDANGALTDEMWDAAAMLTDPLITPPASRTLLTAARNENGRMVGMTFEPTSRFDDYQKQGLMLPGPQDPADTLQARVSYLRGDRTLELAGRLRSRRSVLGAMIHAQPVYVGMPSGKYADNWPQKIHGAAVSAPETALGAQSYARFVADNAHRPPMLYVAANDGMLHAFYAPLPMCKKTDAQGRCTIYANGQHAGKERWAYVPRGVYSHLGHLTHARPFPFQPTVDATPVVRDVFFSQHGKHEWHSLLVGGLALGGRGVYALDITEPDATNVVDPERTVLWEFDADAPIGIAQSGAPYNPSDLGYTYGQPAIARLANGRWAVLVPGGYFADCSQPVRPVGCAASRPPGYSPLFVLDAQTGSVMAELTTPSVEGVTSYGLTTPVLGDYANDQVDEVAFAGDLAGNLWRFDLSSPDPANWKVTLAYRPMEDGAQPITIMPRLFPDPASDRFIVVFGTGKYVGRGDKHDIRVQSIYGIRDRVDGKGQSVTVTRDALQRQIMREETVIDAGSGSRTRWRTLSSNPVSTQASGWYVDLDVVAGERVIATPLALFNDQTVWVSTLIPDGDTPTGSILAMNAVTGGPRSIVSFADASYAGVLIENPPISGMLPMVMRLGGGKLILPGVKVKERGKGLDGPLSLNAPLWRRRSWSLLTPDS